MTNREIIRKKYVIIMTIPRNKFENPIILIQLNYSNFFFHLYDSLKAEIN